MKAAFRVVLVAAVCGLLLLIFTGPALASSGPNYKIKVENRTDFRCVIWVIYGGVVTERVHAESVIGPHSSTTVETGAACPFWIEGTCGGETHPFTPREFPSRCTLGPECRSPSHCGTICTSTCWSSDWNITCKKTKDQVPLEDGDFTLNK